MNIGNFLRATILKNICEQLLLLALKSTSQYYNNIYSRPLPLQLKHFSNIAEHKKFPRISSCIKGNRICHSCPKINTISDWEIEQKIDELGTKCLCFERYKRIKTLLDMFQMHLRQSFKSSKIFWKVQ